MATIKCLPLIGFALLGGVLCADARADGSALGIYNPLGMYVGAGIGRATINQTQFDSLGDYFRHVDDQPLGWNAVIGVRPSPILGAEAEFIDFGEAKLGAGLVPLIGSSAQQFLGGSAHDQAAAVFAVGYLPLPIPWLEPFGKIGWSEIWDHDRYTGVYSNLINGAANGLASASQTTHPTGAAYGGGLQFHFEQLAVRAEYERISGSRPFGGWNNPALMSLGLLWTF
jgi:hypothetical protein